MALFGLFGDENKRHVKKLKKIADKIEALSEEYSALTDEQLQAKTDEFKTRLKNGETLDGILPEAFATVREASTRVLGMRHFYVQLLGGIVLHQGRIAEMKTGEGKTLVATLPVYLNALTGDGVHVVTVNEYLARYHAEWMGKLYNFLGLSVGVNLNGIGFEEKKKVYQSDVVYTTNSELGFDYLRDNMATSAGNKVLRGLNFVIVDEVDSVLIDEARTPLIVSGPGEKSSELYRFADSFVKRLRPDDYEIDEKQRTVRLTDEGVSKAEAFFRIDNLSDYENVELNDHIVTALRANYVMKRDDNYIVSNGEVVIIDEFTGRQMPGRRFSEGLHQAIEAKEGVRIQNESPTLATITYQNFFRMYKKLSGMTGTAKTEEAEFEGIYGLDVIEIPTNKPVVRVDEQDQLYTTTKGKINAVINDIISAHEKGQPVLVGTVTVEKSEELSRELNRKRIPHVVLNAKNHEKEAEIIAQAGKKGSVTIATNMAGRGTDILLGGNPEFSAKEKLAREKFTHEQILFADSPVSSPNPDIEAARVRFRELLQEYKKETDADKEEVVALGGLRVIGTERHESRRIDNQLRGRSGRQGDPGSSVFYISLDDDLARVFGGERLRTVTNAFHFEEDQPISMKILTKRIEGAQKAIESRNYSSRKTVLSYDDVINAQREVIYGERNKVLNGLDIREEIIGMIDDVAAEVVDEIVGLDAVSEQNDVEKANDELNRRLLGYEGEVITEELLSGNVKDLVKAVAEAAHARYNDRIEESKNCGIDFAQIERMMFLRALDNRWMHHIDDMDKLRKGITLRAYGQQDPLIAYKREGLDMFEAMEEAIKRLTVVLCLSVRFDREPKEEKPKKIFTNAGADKTAPKSPAVSTKTVGRNDPCPCGSGKKYKKCCGKNL